MLLFTGSFLANLFGEDPTGSGRHLTITADSVKMGFSQMGTDAFRAGDLTLTAREVQITDSAGLSASSSNPLGKGGSMLVTSDQLMLNNTGFEVLAGSEGSGGITINGKAVEIRDGTAIRSATFASGDAGDITITVTDHLTLADDPSIGTARPSGLFTNSFGNFGQGNAGTVIVTTPKLEMTGGARIESSTRSSGRGGAVSINADVISIQGERSSENFEGFFSQLGSSRASGIYTRTVGSEFCSGTCGDAGNVLITTNSLNLADGGQINSGTISTGQGGNIVVNATGAITLSGTGSDGTPSGILSQAAGTVPEAGRGGSISLASDQTVSLSNGATTTASSTGPGNTGNIQITAGNQFAMTNSTVTTEANQSGGGAIKITTTPSGTVELTDSTISASVLDGTGGGGSVDIDPQFVILQNSQILANAVFGPGGNINITTNLLLPDSSSVISASSQFGQQGTIFIQSPISPASGKIVPLGQKPLIPVTLLSQRCAALAGGNASSFTVAGRDSLPAEPGGWVPTPLALAALNAGTGQEERGEGDAEEAPLLSLRKIAPPGFLTQSFAVDSSAGCAS